MPIAPLLLALLFVPSAAAQDTMATVTTAAPIYVVPEANRTPLRTAAVGTRLRVLEDSGEWVRVEFQNPQYGKRVGYVQAKSIRVNGVTQPPAPAPVLPPAAAAPAVVASSNVPAAPTVAPPATAIIGRPESAASSGRVSVYLKGTGSDAGFTDPSKERQDSVKDLQKKLKDSKAIAIVDAATDAVIVLEVLSRETKRESNGWTALSGAKQNKSYLMVKLTAGEYSTQFEGESGSKGMLKGYGAAAGKVVDQLEAWIDANRSRLSQISR